MKKDFLEFIQTKNVSLPNQVSQNITQKIHREIRIASAPVWMIFTKYFTVQFIAGVLTLTVCPQFGLGPIGGGHGISHYFMQFGMWACGLFCAFVFFGFSHLVTSLVLYRSEHRRVTKNIWMIPSAFSMTFFILMITGKSINYDPMFFQYDFITSWVFAGLLISFAAVYSRLLIQRS